MLRASLIALFLLTGSAYAGQEIDVCNNCRITYQTKVVKKVVRPVQQVYAPVVPVAPVVPYQVVGAMPMGPGPITSTVEVPLYAPVAPPVITPRQSCAWYVDPYDLFGQLFGNPDLVQSCVYY
jgi:dipeptidase